jgi:hypothetical protein
MGSPIEGRAEVDSVVQVDVVPRLDLSEAFVVKRVRLNGTTHLTIDHEEATGATVTLLLFDYLERLHHSSPPKGTDGQGIYSLGTAERIIGVFHPSGRFKLSRDKVGLFAFGSFLSAMMFSPFDGIVIVMERDNKVFFVYI